MKFIIVLSLLFAHAYAESESKSDAILFGTSLGALSGGAGFRVYAHDEEKEAIRRKANSRFRSSYTNPIILGNQNRSIERFIRRIQSVKDGEIVRIRYHQAYNQGRNQLLRVVDQDFIYNENGRPSPGAQQVLSDYKAGKIKNVESISITDSSRAVRIHVTSSQLRAIGNHMLAIGLIIAVCEGYAYDLSFDLSE
jgi:hypothetical protein